MKTSSWIVKLSPLFFWSLVLGACNNGLSPADFLNPAGNLAPTDSANSNFSQPAETDETEDAQNDPEAIHYDVPLDGDTVTVSLNQNSLAVDDAAYAIPEDEEYSQVITLDSEDILSGESPFSYSAATDSEREEEIPDVEALPSEDYEALPTSPTAPTPNQATENDDEPYNESDLGEEITVAQIPAPPPKEDEPTTEPCDPEESIESVAAPITAAPQPSRPSLPSPSKNSPSAPAQIGQSVFLIPDSLLKNCGDIETADLPPALQKIKSVYQKSINSGCTPRKTEGVPVSCRYNPGASENAGEPVYTWQILPKSSPEKNPQGKTPKAAPGHDKKFPPKKNQVEPPKPSKSGTKPKTSGGTTPPKIQATPAQTTVPANGAFTISPSGVVTKKATPKKIY